MCSKVVVEGCIGVYSLLMLFLCGLIMILLVASL